jgi:hypothetical protein
MEEDRRRYRRSIVIPILLIVVGAVILLYNLNLLPADIWQTFFNLWPILLIALGLDATYRGNGMVGPVFLIGLGIVFLFSNLGYLEIGVWELILSLWPILLIAFGLDIIIGRRSPYWSMAGVVITVLLLIGVLWLFTTSPFAGRLLEGEQISQPLDGTRQAEVQIEQSAGSLRLVGSPETSDLIHGEIFLSGRERLESDFSFTNGSARFILRSSGTPFFTLSRWREPWTWNLVLNRQVPIDLQVNLGAGRALVDLHNLQIERLDLQVGAGDLTIILPAEGIVQGNIEGAVGQTTLFIPAGMAVRLRTDTGLTAIQAPGDFTIQEDVYISPGFETAPNRSDLDVSQALGNLRIRYLQEETGRQGRYLQVQPAGRSAR